MSSSRTKTILCLANSRKLQGRCVAGLEWDGLVVGNWVRPVSSREHEGLSASEMCYYNFLEPKPLDVIELES